MTFWKSSGSQITDPDPALFVSDLQDVFLLITFCRYICIILHRQKVIEKSQDGTILIWTRIRTSD
jgi:hypothetical protein